MIMLSDSGFAKSRPAARVFPDLWSALFCRACPDVRRLHVTGIKWTTVSLDSFCNFNPFNPLQSLHLNMFENNYYLDDPFLYSVLQLNT